MRDERWLEVFKTVYNKEPAQQCEHFGLGAIPV
jgi:hypothetical protein